MTDVWYPGRAPLKSPEIISDLAHFTGYLTQCLNNRDASALDGAAATCAHCLAIALEESDECLGSDTTLNALMKMLPLVLRAAQLCVANQSWDDLDPLIADVDAVRWGFIQQLEKSVGEHSG
ncbi:hypothetical protein KJ782_07055 [Patescibacteria group bacterium]|nr:hypothetical protein [Patescibacteria group bacterium]